MSGWPPIVARVCLRQFILPTPGRLLQIALLHHQSNAGVCHVSHGGAYRDHKTVGSRENRKARKHGPCFLQSVWEYRLLKNRAELAADVVFVLIKKKKKKRL